jgi:hypothetical protein
MDSESCRSMLQTYSATVLENTINKKWETFGPNCKIIWYTIYDTIIYDTILYDTIYDMTWHDTTRHDTTRYDMIYDI